MNTFVIHFVGYLGALGLICGFVPQAWRTIRTRDTEGISAPAFLFITLGALFFFIQGLLILNWPLVITNAITCVSSATVYAIKMFNDRKKCKENKDEA